jgi:LysM repeat protein
LAFRRRVLAALAGFFVSATVVGSAPGLRALWWAAAADGLALVAYIAVLVHARNVTARHEWDLARLLPESDRAWRVATDEAHSRSTERSGDGASNQVLDRWALLPFMLACLAGSLLTPFVTVSRWLARTDLAFAKAWAERMAALQTSMRQRSRRALTVSVAATVGVTGLGSMLNVAMAQPASAAPAAMAPISATLTEAGSAPAAAAPTDASASHYGVVRGDTLWGISHHFYGNGTQWPQIAHANPSIANPNLIFPGQDFVIPGSSSLAQDAGSASTSNTPGSVVQQPQAQEQAQSQEQVAARLARQAPAVRQQPQSPAQAPVQALPTPASRPDTPPVAIPPSARVVPAQPAPSSQSVPAASAAGPSLASIWACIRQHESGGNYADTSGGGYYGAYQFLPSTWNAAMIALGMPQYANGRADLAPPWVQDRAAQWLQARSGWGQWPVASRLCGAN